MAKKVFEEVLRKPVTGIPLLMLLLVGVFLLIGKVVAQMVVPVTQGVLLETWYYDFIYGYGILWFDPDSLLGNLLIGEYGVFTMVPIYLLGLLFPLVFSFNFVLTLLIDSRLFPYISALSDGAFRRIGLSGAALIPMILGFGCVTAALISASSLPTKREQIITSILLCITVPCSAQLAILMAVAATLSLGYLSYYFATIALIFIVSGMLLNQIIPGSSGPYHPDYPKIQFPSLIHTIQKTVRTSWYFLTDAAPTFVLGGVLMSLLSYYNGFSVLYRLFSPITQGLLHLPKEATSLFLLSIVKKDMGAGMLYSIVTNLSMTQLQITVSLIVTTLFVPCFASTMVLYKDRGFLTASLVWVSSFLISILLGALSSNILTLC